MNKKNLLLLLCFACVQFLPAQKLPSTLLWKISGNGLQKPSYLYGTMHLTDERIFNIGDSVYAAIENSEGFATEIDPEEFTPFVIDEAKRSYMESVRIKDMMSRDEFKQYGKILAKKLNKDENDITTADILHAKNKWIHESYSTGKMETFLDVYLFDIARRQGKWTGGVEDLQDQENLMDLVDESDIKQLAIEEDDKNIDKEYNRVRELFIRSYINNNLDAIDSLSYTGDSLYEDALLVKRNKKMAMRMDSLGHERSMVFAVGAAHLPGEQGLIALLQERGFTVTPVFSSKKIKPQNYKVAEISLPWYEVKDEDGFYTASMPGKPGDLTMYGLLTMKMYFDPFKSTLYMTTAMHTPYSKQMADSVFGVVASYYFGTNDYTKGKPVTIDNVPGREFLSAKENYSHGYLLFKDGVMYIAVAMSMKKDTSAASSVNRFLHSFSIPEQQLNNGYSITYTNKIKAYRVDLPAQPRSAGDMLSSYKDSTLNKEINVVSDPVSGSYLFFGTNEAAKGYFIENDSLTLAQIRESQKDKFAEISIDTVYIRNGRRVMEFEGTMAEAPLTMKTHYEFRGNRWYALVAMYDPAKEHASVERYFNSFALLDYAPNEWNEYTPDDKLFSAWAPGQFTHTEKVPDYSEDTLYNYETYDSSRADSYGIVATRFGKYYWQNSDSALWDETIRGSVDYNDTLLSKKQVTNGEAKGYEIEVKQYGSGNIKRKRILLNGDKKYSVFTVQAAAEINNANNNKFFESFRFNTLLSDTAVFVSKAAILLKDISSLDSATRDRALAYLHKAPFQKNELPLLHDALLISYPANEDDYDGTKNDLEKIIIDLHDTSSYRFAKNNYATADDTTKIILLAIMANFPTQENFNDIKTILLNQPPRITPDYDLVNRLTDTMQLNAVIFPELLPLLKDTVMAPFIIRMADKLLDSGFADKALLQPYHKNILQLAQKNYEAAKNDPHNYDGLNYTLIELLGKINTAESNALLQQWSLLKDDYLQMDAVEMLLHNKQGIDPSVLKALAADNVTRTELYDSLKAYKKEDLFPAHYRTQKYFAESYVYIVASDDDEEPGELTYLTQKVIDFKGRQSRFFFYKITYGEGDDQSYSLGCAGPFHINAADVSSEDAYGDIYDEEFDPSDADAQMDALIEQMEGWYKWKEENKK